jgi:hypothetical protein
MPAGDTSHPNQINPIKNPLDSEHGIYRDKTLVLTGKLSPTLFGLFMQQMRLRLVRRLPFAFG